MKNRLVWGSLSLKKGQILQAWKIGNFENRPMPVGASRRTSAIFSAHDQFLGNAEILFEAKFVRFPNNPKKFKN
jgi:hypothetical protein